jgi:hypothetical protein
MSPSGRYQSRLFSFFSQQSLRLKDTASRTWRQAKLAAVWGTQIALYPIYALFQTGRLLGRQMGQASRKTFPWLSSTSKNTTQQSIFHPTIPFPNSLALPSDTPIQNLLESCLKITPVSQNSLAQNLELPLFVQGFSSLLSTRTLVLVTAENEILDILTPTQQTWLQQQIIWELANYWRHQKSQLPEEKSHLQLGWADTFLPLPKERANLLPPVRAFRNLMAWVQLSPIAIATNLFQESRLEHLALPSSPPVNHANDIFSSPPEPSPLLAWVKHQAIGVTKFSKSLVSVFQNSSIALYDPLPKNQLGAAELFPIAPQTKSPPSPEAQPPQQPWLEIEDFFGGELLGVAGTERMIERNNGKEKKAIAPPVATAPPASLLEAETLEAKVTSASYEKHPLEQLLQWLDHGMLWIEQKLGQVWSWIHRS